MNLKIGKKTLLEKKVHFNATITQTYIEPVVNGIFQTTYFWFPHSKNNLYSFFTFLTPKIGAFFTSRIFLNIVIDNLKLKTVKAFAVRKGRNQKISNVTFSVMVVVYCHCLCHPCFVVICFDNLEVQDVIKESKVEHFGPLASSGASGDL